MADHVIHLHPRCYARGEVRCGEHGACFWSYRVRDVTCRRCLDAHDRDVQRCEYLVGVTRVPGIYRDENGRVWRSPRQRDEELFGMGT